METKEGEKDIGRNDGRQQASYRRKTVQGWQYDGKQWKLGRAFDVVWLPSGAAMVEVKTKRGFFRVLVKAFFLRNRERAVNAVSFFK